MKKKSGGRATPKGTVNKPKPTTQKPDSRHDSHDFAAREGTAGKGPKQAQWTARPETHNRGNR